jgi:hypothetical protein
MFPHSFDSVWPTIAGTTAGVRLGVAQRVTYPHTLPLPAKGRDRWSHKPFEFDRDNDLRFHTTVMAGTA